MSKEENMEALNKRGELKMSFADIMKEQDDKAAIDKQVGVVRNPEDRRVLRMEVTEQIDRERRKNKLVIMEVPEEGEDGGGSGIAEKVIKELIPESEVKFIVLGRI